MVGRQAKVLTTDNVNAILSELKLYADPERSLVMFLLSTKAGLRAGEIAKLEWPMVLDASGRISDVLVIEDRIAKKKSGRRIPINPALRTALAALHRKAPHREGPVVRAHRGGHMRPGSIVAWFAALYRDLKLEGCSSHSGRRTFVTRAARLVHRTGGSVKDIQILAGHRSLTTTELYIEGNSFAQRKLVALI
jgi:integrase/recombinase XerD